MFVEVLYRVQADPIEHLGCRSLVRLQAFEFGYSFLYPTKAKSYAIESTIHDWIIRLYQPSFGEEMSAMWILQKVAHDDHRAFDLFFDHLNTVLSAHPEALLSPEVMEGRTVESPNPVSALLELLVKRPRMYLQRLNPGCLRAFLDGYRLACLEEGYFECADLDGFEHWVRRELNLKGMFRWENAALASFQGNEEDAFTWSLRELKAYRESRGAPSIGQVIK